jgi:hypothetical protein
MYAAKARKQTPTTLSAFLISFPKQDIRVNRHPPQQDCPGRNFDEAIDSKTDQGNATGHSTGDDSHQTFHDIPRDGEAFEPSPTAHDRGTFQNAGWAHTRSLQPSYIFLSGREHDAAYPHR